VQSLSSIVSRSTFIFLISFLVIVVSVVVCSGDVSSVYAKKLKSYEVISIIEPGLTFQPLVSGFAFPTGMAFVDPDNILVIEKNTGRVIQIRNGTEMKEPLLDVNVANMSERGLLGIAISHNNNNVSAPPYVFLYYTETEGKMVLKYWVIDYTGMSWLITH